jgi:isoquinoline 1-oxidoreductase alpha subunit
LTAEVAKGCKERKEKRPWFDDKKFRISQFPGAQAGLNCYRIQLSNPGADGSQPQEHKERKMIAFSVNGKRVNLDVDPSTPLLWVIRDHLGLTGTKYGCGMAQCGACTVHIDGEAVRSCVAPVSRAAGKAVTTIEGLSPDLTHPLQLAWIAEDVPQCGYCQSGQLMSAAVLLREKPQPTDEDIDEAMTGNICRCGTYPRIRRAIHRAAGMVAKGGAQ